MEYFINHSHKESGGLFGSFNTQGFAFAETHTGLYTIQHRGERSARIAALVGDEMILKGGDGLVRNVFTSDMDEKSMFALGFTAFNSSGRGEKQPAVSESGRVALAFDGVLVSQSVNGYTHSYHESESARSFANTIDYFLKKGARIAAAIYESTQYVRGIFAALALDKEHKTLAGFTDSTGGKPLVVGKTETGFVFSSEDCSWNALNATPEYELQAGETVVITENGYDVAKKSETNKRSLDILELLHLQNTASHFRGKSIYDLRRALGEKAGERFPLQADLVMSIPDNAHTVGMAYAEKTGIDWELPLMANRYLTRVNVAPTIMKNNEMYDVRFNVMNSVVRDKNVVLVEDYLGTGRTSIRILHKMQNSKEGYESKELHLVVAAPEYVTASLTDPRVRSTRELLSVKIPPEKLAQFFRVNSLNFLALPDFMSALDLTEDDVNVSCFKRM